MRSARIRGCSFTSSLPRMSASGARSEATSWSTNTDIYLSRDIVNMVARQLLRPMVLYRATRLDLKSWLDGTNLDEAVLTDPRNQAALNVLKRPYLTNAAGDFLLLDRFSFHALRGFNEVIRFAKIHIDANFCFHARRERTADCRHGRARLPFW